MPKAVKKTLITVKFEIQIGITSYPLTPYRISYNLLHILMHNTVLHISKYLFPWLQCMMRSQSH